MCTFEWGFYVAFSGQHLSLFIKILEVVLIYMSLPLTLPLSWCFSHHDWMYHPHSIFTGEGKARGPRLI